jgi:ParB family chromosome partitioning protein
MSLLARENVLSRVATGEVKQVTELALDPKRVRVWQGNPRHQESLTEESCRDLIDAIKSEGGQKVPAIVRRVQGDRDHDYEVIAGTRRHWVISWLRANSYPDMKFIAQVHALDDEAAFRLSDIENRARKDVSDYERACTYARALDLHYGGKQARMAERLNVSKGWLSKLLTVAALPDWIVAAFGTLADIQLKACYPLAQKIQALTQERDREALSRFQAVAKRLADDQAARRRDGKPAIGAVEILAQLAKADAPTDANEALVKFESASGRIALSVLSSNRNGVSIRLHAGSGASQKDLEGMFREALTALEKQGRGLRC